MRESSGGKRMRSVRAEGKMSVRQTGTEHKHPVKKMELKCIPLCTALKL